MRTRRFTPATCLAAAIWIAAGGCASASKPTLEERNAELGRLLADADRAVADANRRLELERAERLAAEQDAALARARLESKAIAASLAPEAREDATVPAAAPSTEDGFAVNPASGGVIVEGGLLFVPGTDRLRLPVAVPVLERLAAEVNRDGARDHLVRVEGHLDRDDLHRSSTFDPWELAGKRALVVLRWLEAHGVAADRLQYAGLGATRPLDPRSSPEARARNRRVEVLLLRRK